MNNKTLLNHLNISYPIFQAPMAGVTTPLLVATVSNYGAIGNIGAGYLSKEDTKQFIDEVRSLTDAPFGINVFVPEKNEVNEQQVELSFELMKNHLHRLGEEVEHIPDYKSVTNYEKQIEVILNEHVPVCSFTFGIPDDDIVKEMKKRGIFVIGTATTVREAQLVEQANMDAVVVQGSEAGGHRGTFHEQEHLIGTMALLPQVVDSVSIPVIAAGGIMDGRGLMASLNLGAEAVQLGTAFLTTKECGANPVHKSALLHATEDETVLTKAFSGKTARGLNNEFIDSMKRYETKLPPFPYQNAFTTKLRTVAAKQNNKQYMSLWSGQAPRLTKDVTANELLDHIINQYESIRNEIVSFK